MRINDTLYFDHQATTPVDARVLTEMSPFFGTAFGNPHSTDHVIGWRASGAVERAAADVAALTGADGDEVVFTSGATEANNLALLGISRHAEKQPRRRILISAVEHKSVLACARVLEERHGYDVQYIPVDSQGIVDLDFLESNTNSDVLLISVMAVNNEIGSIQPIEKIAKITAYHGAIFHCDAAQSPVAIDMGHLAQHADLLSLSAHKMYGPAGIGALIVRRDLQNRVEPVIHGGGQQGGLRSGTLPLPLCVGMGAAARILLDGDLSDERFRLRKLRNRFVRRIQEGLSATRLNGPKDALRHPGNANICFPGIGAQELLGVLQPRIAASTGSACTSGIPEPSHVLRNIGLSGTDADSSIRFSFGRHTTEADIDEAVDLILSAVDSLKSNTLEALA